MRSIASQAQLPKSGLTSTDTTPLHAGPASQAGRASGPISQRSMLDSKPRWTLAAASSTSPSTQPPATEPVQRPS